ncbi:uncharacterized protein LOC134571246 [Pelobates fuscus]|uniref:uncharacterized protein LOC134571246 n=1 Tax=Pelobates fuscus TaxID=191477 RepID=UPI002FE4B030
MPHVEKPASRFEHGSSEPCVKKSRPNDYAPWTDQNITGHSLTENRIIKPNLNSCFPLSNKGKFEEKYGGNKSSTVRDPPNDAGTLVARSRGIYDLESRECNSNSGKDEPDDHLFKCAFTEADTSKNCPVSSATFSLTSSTFIGPLFPPPKVKNVSQRSSSKDSTVPPYKIKTVELRKATNSKGDNGMDYELRQFYKELHQLEDETETVDVHENKCTFSNTIQEPVCMTSSPYNTQSSQDVHSVPTHKNTTSSNTNTQTVCSDPYRSNITSNNPFLNNTVPPRFHVLSLQNIPIKENVCGVNQEPFSRTSHPHSSGVGPQNKQTFNRQTEWREHNVSNRTINPPFLYSRMPPGFPDQPPQCLFRPYSPPPQNKNVRENECSSNNIQESFYSSTAYNNALSSQGEYSVIPHNQISYNRETVWREHEESNRTNNSPFLNNAVPPRFSLSDSRGPPREEYNYTSNFQSQNNKPYVPYPQKQNHYGCNDKYQRPDEQNEMPSSQNKYNDQWGSFRQPFHEHDIESKHKEYGSDICRSKDTSLHHALRTFSEPHLNKDYNIKPFDRYKRTLVLLRGVPGSGKSTLARGLLEQCPDGIVFSTDDYFGQEEGYTYDVKLLGDAHNWNQNRAKRAMDDRRSPIIIDNTNIQRWEMKPYVQMAIERDYGVEFLEPDTWWKLDPSELEKRNKHGVPRDKISKMLERYEYDMTVPNVMDSVEPPHLSSSRRAPQPMQRWGSSVDSLQHSTSFHNR